ncbi:MAG: hypothetical protein ACLSBH_07695 [Coprobacillus cateniformis]
MDLNQLIIYRNLTDDPDVLDCLLYCTHDSDKNENTFISTMLKLTEKYDLHGHLFQKFNNIFISATRKYIYTFFRTQTNYK